MPEGIRKHADFYQLLVYLAISWEKWIWVWFFEDVKFAFQWWLTLPPFF